MIAFLAATEPFWLFVFLGLELAVSLYSAWILTIEYRYDKDWNERRKARRKRTMEFENLNQGEGK